MSISAIHSLRAQSGAGASTQIPGVSVSFLRFVETGQPHVYTNNFTIRPTTNWSLFGPRTTALGVTNVTSTNFISGGPAAVFRYANSSSNLAYVALQSIEQDVGGQWKKIAIPADANAMLMMAPNATATQTIPVPATNMIWRVTAFCIEQASGVARAVEQAQLLGKQALTGEKTDRFTGRKYFIMTNSPPSK